MGLKKYKAKRDFSKTAEPKGGKPLPKQVRGASRFLIQKHDARRLHYDFRLQMEGVLKSWALPRGLPWQQGEKHLAVEVEDHPIEYGDFEGVIPQGQYGGGTVMLWDRGAYYVYGEQPLKSLREGKLHLVLAGEKAIGEWTLVRIRGRDGEKNQWLILKTGGSAEPPSKKAEDQSVKTGRTMKQIAEERDAEWESNREEKNPSERSRLKSRIKAALKKKDQKIAGRDDAKNENIRSGSQLLKKLPASKPRFIEPMKARLVDDPPRHGDWLYELKFDGIRAITVKNNSKTSLISRNGNKLDARFPEIAEAVKNLPVRECVIDGEVVALDDEGRSSFQLLQALEMEGRKAPLRFYVFDLLELEGKSLLGLPLEQRKQVLAKLCGTVGDPIRYSGEISGDVKSLLGEVQRRGLEGLIGKQRDSVYEPGRRSGTWIKLKCLNEQEFVIGGYTLPAGSRKYFGAVLVGYYEGGKLKFAGKVGSGFTSKSLSILDKKFRDEEREDCPFVDLPSKQGGDWVQGITPSMMKKLHWVNPKFVAEIKFAEWTRDGKLRQPVFLGLREDKDATEVGREAA
ncbi:MAG TPA: non-homologous end-joining DNA ligase [Chthoniobacterales bacterium]|nr:non-homologous end-joining DNA ligase [Chthoniobacterales bacterium]